MRFRTIGVFVASLGLAMFATAQTKISGTNQCPKPDSQNSVEVGDRPNHSFMISQVKCAWTKPWEINGVQGKEGVATAFDEVSGSRSSTRAFYVDTMANGDKARYRYGGSATLKDGALQTAEGTWTLLSGTGKLKGVKGKGTYKGKATADGGVTYEVEGEYTAPK